MTRDNDMHIVIFLVLLYYQLFFLYNVLFMDNDKEHTKLKRLLCIGALFCHGLAFIVLSPPMWGQHYDFRTYSVKAGLSQSQVYSIFQCRRGYLWVGTYGGGLNRFDGKTFTPYSLKDGLSDNVVFCSVEDREGNLWIGTDLGLNKFDGKTFTAITTEDGLPGNTIRCIYIDDDDSIWLGTDAYGFCRFEPQQKRFTVYRTPGDKKKTGLADDRVRSIARDSRGMLWITTLAGVSAFKNGRFSNNRATRKLAGKKVNHVTEDSRNRVWFATTDGAFIYSGHHSDQPLTHITTREGLINDNVTYILDSRTHGLWFATVGGIGRWNAKTRTITNYTTDQGLPDNIVSWIMEDREGHLWFGTERGICQFRGNTFTYFTAADGLENETVWSIYQDQDGLIWMGTEKGMYTYDPANGSLTAVKAYGDDMIYPFYPDQDGRLWFGNGKTIIMYDGSTYNDIGIQLRLGKVEVFSIFRDRDGIIWLGTARRGAFRLQGRTFTNFTTKNGLVDNMVNTIAQDTRGNFWFGTNEGISVYTPGTGEFTTVTTADWLTNRSVSTILVDEKGTLWVGTYGGGVIRYTPYAEDKSRANFDTLNSNDGLMDDEVGLMIFDNKGNLWIGTNKGISSLDIAVYRETGEKKLNFYGEEDGFTGIECNQNAVYKDKNGSLWFGTIRGAVRMDPGEELVNRVKPAVHITSAALFYTETDLSRYAPAGTGTNYFGLPYTMQLPPDKNHLTFHYIGISLTAPGKVRYRVKLEGFDPSWSLPSAIPSATYSNLPPGEYTFSVTACNNNGLWASKPTDFHFTIADPWWQQWWFLVLIILAVLVFILGVSRLRVKHFKMTQRLLEEQVSQRTGELEAEKQKVQQINRDLEARVAERTRTLEATTRRLNHAQKMEAMGTLAGGVAHDLNNVMASIVGYPEVLLMELPQDSPLREYVVTIQEAGEKSAAIVQDLLTLARRGVNVSEAVSLNAVISGFLKSPECKKTLSYHPWVELESHLDARLDKIMGSPVHLFKTVMNLVSNAVEAMPARGSIVITTFNKTLREPLEGYDDVAPGVYVGFSVGDSGVGMNTEDKVRIFEPFYTKKKMGKSGTGLGMAVVWGTVNDHNGYITVDSIEGEGSTFSLYFPVTQKEVKDTSRNRPPLALLKGDGETILVVDDMEEQRNITSLMLTRLGYTVNTASSGEAAVDYVKNHPVDLLVLDMIMDPGINGFETYKRIVELYPNQKAVIVSGFSETENVKKARQLGAGAYLKKPFSLEHLAMTVQKELVDDG